MPNGQPAQLANLKPFVKGVSGNPAGRKTAGAVEREYINAFAERKLKKRHLRRILRRENAPVAMQAAALRMLRQIENGDLSDFAGLLSGENNLEDLRAMGIDTSIVKKFKQKTRKVPRAGGGKGETEELIEREIELHDRSGEDFDRVVTHTDGTPIHRQETKTDVILRTPDDRTAAADHLAARLRAILDSTPN